MTEDIVLHLEIFQFCNMCTSKCSGNCIKFLNQKGEPDLCVKSHKEKNVIENEYKKWDTYLTSKMSENSFLILKLTAALEGRKDKEFICKAEYFQNGFIMNDEFIKDLKKDIKAHLQLICNTKIGKLSAFNIYEHEKLGNEIMNFDKKFSSLETEFSEYTLHSI